MLLPERWFEAIEEASRIYFTANDPEKMIKFLRPLYDSLDEKPQTMNEVTFHQGFKVDLLEAWDWCLSYLESEDIDDINQAWEIYYSIFRKLQKRLKEIVFYELQNVSPYLLGINNTEISVPGLYSADRRLITITGFSPVMDVLKSKQLPRKI